ncbi:MAG: hypothetical protein ACJ73D_12980 [Pyrinomonadaceae bacterium]
MLEYEFCEPEFSNCDCCGAVITRLTRFVTKDSDAYAIYYAYLSEAHGSKKMIGMVSFGEWWIDDVPKSRVAFAFELWADANQYNVGIIDASESPWADSKLTGRKLTRDEALTHPWLDQFFHLTDHMTVDDPAIRAFFEEESVH